MALDRDKRERFIKLWLVTLELRVRVFGEGSAGQLGNERASARW